MANQQFLYQGFIIEGTRGNWRVYDPAKGGAFQFGGSNFKKLKQRIRNIIEKERLNNG